MHMIVSSLGSLFMKHRFFLFHTPIIALGKVFSTTVTIYIMLLVLLRLENHEEREGRRTRVEHVLGPNRHKLTIFYHQ